MVYGAAGFVQEDSRHSDVMLAGGEAASRAMEEKQFPRVYHDAVQKYFSSGGAEEGAGEGSGN